MTTDAVDYSYEELRPDAQGVIRIRTDEQLRLWLIPRNSLGSLRLDLGDLQFPGVYILLDLSHQKVYVGQSDNLTRRLNDHAQRPPNEIPQWTEVLVVTDGRPFALSDFADATIRENLESALIGQFQSSQATIIAVNKQSRSVSPLVWQTIRFHRLWRELIFVLQQRRLLPYTAAAQVSEEFIPLEVFREMLTSHGHIVANLTAYEAEVDAFRCYVRDGSQKPKGWQITLRNAFRNAVRTSEGYLLVNRGPGLMIPFTQLRDQLLSPALLQRSTVDIFVRFHPDSRVTVSYRANEIDITDTALS